ncbi:MAG: glycine radical domain-containing protein, partial [Thermoplasmata archaeon]
YILTGYFNLAKILEVTLANGLDPRTGKRVGPETGDPGRFKRNDRDDVDGIAKSIVHELVDLIERYPPSPVRGASRRVYFLPTTAHVYFGKVTGATPDGRVSGFPVSEGVSPVQGMDRKGMAAVFRSVSKIDWIRTGGSLLNQKLTPDLFDDQGNIIKLASLIRGYFRAGGYHVQFNVISADLLREAQRRPQDFQDLMVRVAGYSDYFVKLPKGLQEEIIARTEQNV